MRSGTLLVRLFSGESGENIAHFFCIDANFCALLEGAEEFAIRLSSRSIRLFGMNKKGFNDAEILMMYLRYIYSRLSSCLDLKSIVLFSIKMSVAYSVT